MTNKKVVAFKIAIDSELWQRLDNLCDHWGSKSNFIRKGIERVVEDEENNRRIINNSAVGER